MRALVLAIVALAITTPAWANILDDMYAVKDAIELCQRSGTRWTICYLKNADEKEALAKAKKWLDDCDIRDKSLGWGNKWVDEYIDEDGRECKARRAYIKGRWGK